MQRCGLHRFLPQSIVPSSAILKAGWRVLFPFNDEIQWWNVTLLNILCNQVWIVDRVVVARNVAMLPQLNIYKVSLWQKDIQIKNYNFSSVHGSWELVFFLCFFRIFPLHFQNGPKSLRNYYVKKNTQVKIQNRLWLMRLNSSRELGTENIWLTRF